MSNAPLNTQYVTLETRLSTQLTTLIPTNKIKQFTKQNPPPQKNVKTDEQIGLKSEKKHAI